MAEARIPDRPLPSTSHQRGRFAWNLATNLGALVLSLLVALWFTPYLIHHLGVAAYGLIPLITQLTGYLAILTVALNSAVGRYLTIALERREYDEANRYFNASFFGSLLLIAVLVVPAGFAAGHIHRLVSTPAGQEVQAGWLMGCALTAFFLQTLLTPFGVAQYCMNRFDLRNLVAITEYVVRVGVVAVLFALFTPRLWQVGVAMIAATLVSGALSLRIWRNLTPMLRVSFAQFGMSTVGKLAAFGGWTSVTQIGTLLFLAIDLLVVNRLFGPLAGGRYAAVLQWSALLRTLAGTIVMVFGPTMLFIYARNDIDGLVSYTWRAMKFTGLLLGLPIALVCGFSAPLLRTWLGPDFVSLAPLMSLMTIHLSVNLVVQPLWGIQTATNRVAVPGVVTLVMGAANLGLALLFAGPVGWGLYGVAAAGALTLTAKNLLFTSVYSAHCLGREYSVFFRPVLRLLALTTVTVAVCFGLSKALPLSGWHRLGPAALVVSAAYVAVVLATQVSPAERATLWATARSLVQGVR